MTEITETVSYVRCDICRTKDIRGRKKQVIINEQIFDICFGCFEKKFNPMMEFLNLTVGLNMEYRIRGQIDTKGKNVPG